MSTLIDDDTIAFGEEDNFNPNKLTHPVVTFFHLAFRIAALFLYIFGSIFSKSYIGLFVTIVLLLSCDFWTVKNITGRIMVGLRWWNYIDDEGKSHWVFESRKGDAQNRVNPSEARIFWIGLLGVTILWTLFFIFSLFSLSFRSLLLICIALTLNYANVYGYMKCRFGQNSDNATLGSTISSFTTDFIRKQVIQNMASMATRPPPSTNVPPPSVV
ncbi:uncharacterized Golgi apparatus membrane protein-like protein CG5021 isoform X1 [Planococcus citri]|uniref:uncharacterized Golgi apparatus membrane protein-like protein CG5021 isoform X1 n=1 Tax=Planococcus citri TaxID=170843 RepID=UPI0031F8A338